MFLKTWLYFASQALFWEMLIGVLKEQQLEMQYSGVSKFFKGKIFLLVSKKTHTQPLIASSCVIFSKSLYLHEPRFFSSINE